MKPSGNIFYEDEYQTIYIVVWDTVDGIMDITTETRQPFIWGKPPEGYIENKTLFLKGLVTIDRKAIRVNAGEYTVIAEGASQFIDFIQVSKNLTHDNFAYHCDHMLTENMDITIIDGPCWSDPDVVTNVWSWADVASDGSEVTPTGVEDLVWSDVW